MPTYALGRPLPSPPPFAHGGGGAQKAQEKIKARGPGFCGAVRGATEFINALIFINFFRCWLLKHGSVRI